MATTKYVAGTAPTFLMPCSSNPTEPDPFKRFDLQPSIRRFLRESATCGGCGVDPGGKMVP